VGRKDNSNVFTGIERGLIFFCKCDFYMTGEQSLCAEVTFGCAPCRLHCVKSSISFLGFGLFELTADLVVGEWGGGPYK
jgi:hypothetical protein